MHDPYALTMPHWPKPFASAPGTPSARARALLAKLNHPERKLPPVIHVGGTKGKGSTIAFLRAMLQAAGYRVHAYTSPHLARFNERIVLAGREIDDAQLHRVIEQARHAAGDMKVGFFDATTAAAILAFSETPADILLMEMGLGGSVDATNILDQPRLTVMTTISYDHMEYMGTTLPEIAAFEAGLFKPGVPSVVSYQHASVWKVLEEKAAEIAAPLYGYGRHWLSRLGQESMIFADSGGEATLPMPALPGAHQLVNAGNAIAALTALTECEIRPEHIERGLREVKWKGRLEHMQNATLPEGSELWFDGGHNQAAAQTVALFAGTQWQDKPLYLIFGTTEGKDVASMLLPFAGRVQRVYAVPVKSEPKSYRPEALIGQSPPDMDIQAAESIRDALQDIAARVSSFRALVFGSLYLWLETSQL